MSITKYDCQITVTILALLFMFGGIIMIIIGSIVVSDATSSKYIKEYCYNITWNYDSECYGEAKYSIC